MAEETLTLAAVNAAIAAALKPVTDALGPIQQNQKVIADTMAADAAAKAKADKAAADREAADAAAQPAPAAGAAGAQAAKPLTSDDVAKLVSDTLAAQLKARDTAAQTDAARAAFISDKLKGVPVAYHGKLGSDPAKWAAEEQAIRDGFKADLASLGLKAPDVSGGNPGGVSGSGGTPARPATISSLTPGQNAFANGLTIPSADTVKTA